MVKIRLARRGRKRRAIYDIVVADARAPRDGRFIEKLGTYNPNVNPALIDFDTEKAFDWVMKGAQPTDTVRAMLSYTGVLFRKHLQIGVNKGAITQEDADKKLAEWMKAKEAKIQGKIDNLSKTKDAEEKSRLEAETKKKETRAEAIKAKNVVEEEVVEEVVEEAATEATEAPAEEAPAAEGEASTEDTKE